MLAGLIDTGWPGNCIGVGEARAQDNHGFWPGEAPAMSRATPVRRAEFAAGRAAARGALRAVGLVPFSIPMGPDRAPVWPVGVVGSITHSDGYCLAVAARREAHSALGIDIEPMAPLPADLWPEILTEDERDWLSVQPEGERGTLARMVFSAKEATYKAVYPLCREVVGFHAMSIRPDPANRVFRARLNRAFGPCKAGSWLTGQLMCEQGCIATLMALPAKAEYGRNVAEIDELEMECFHSLTA